MIRTLSSDAEKGPEGGGSNASYSLPAEAGINRAVWDLRTDPTTSLDYGVVFGAARDDDAVQGYRVAPGTYGVRISLGDVVQETEVEVVWDPINTYEAARLEEQQAFLADAFGMIDGIFRRVKALQGVQQQVELRKSLAEADGNDAVVAAADALLDELKAWQESATTPSRETFQDVINFAPQIDSFLINVYQVADNSVLGLTQGQRDRLDDLRPRWQTIIDAYDELMRNQVAEFNRSAGPALIIPDWN